MGKKRVGRYPREYREEAVKRMKASANITALAKELDLERRLLYRWRDEFEPPETIGEPAEHIAEGELRKQVAQLKRLLADTMLDNVALKDLLTKKF